MLFPLIIALICTQAAQSQGTTKWSQLPGVMAKDEPSWADLQSYLQMAVDKQFPGSKTIEVFFIGRVLEIEGSKVQLVHWVNRHKMLTINHPIDLDPEYLSWALSKRCLDLNLNVLPRGQDTIGSTFMSTWENAQEMIRECRVHQTKLVVQHRK